MISRAEVAEINSFQLNAKMEKKRWIGKAAKMFGSTPHQCWTTEQGPDLVDFANRLEALSKAVRKEQSAREISERKRMLNLQMKIVCDDEETESVIEVEEVREYSNDEIASFFADMEDWDD